MAKQIKRFKRNIDMLKRLAASPRHQVYRMPGIKRLRKQALDALATRDQELGLLDLRNKI